MENSFAAKHPELVCEWSEKNLPLTPEQIPYGSNKIYWWHGACGHEWTASAKSRHAGEKCPICSGARILVGFNDLATAKPELAAEWSEKNKPLLPTMVTVGSHKKVIWKGKCGHEWVAQIKNRVQQDSGCPYCSHRKVLVGFNDLASLFPEVAAEWSDRNLPLKPTDVMAFANKKVWWKCSHGHEWYTLISTRSGGSKCPYCSGITVLPGFNDFQTLYPELAEEWSERNAPLTPDRISVKSRQNVWWKCKVCGHEWKSVIYSRTKGTTCPVCADRAVKEGYVDRLVSVFGEVKRILKQDGTLWLNIADSYAGSGKGAWSKPIEEQKKNKQTYLYSATAATTNMPKVWNKIKPKDMIGIPWTVAFALRNDGWYLRSDIIWEKPNCLPEPVKDRPTKSYEHLFLLAKSLRYFYNREAIMKPIAESTVERYKRGVAKDNKYEIPFNCGNLNSAIQRITRDCNDEILLKDEKAEVLLPHFSCHSLRHTFTTRMCEAGVNVKVIQDTLGHKDITTTLNIYTDVTKELKKEAFEGLDNFFKS